MCDRCGWRWYANPKPAAAVLLERTDPGADEPSVLLLRRAVEPGLGDWDLPAGYLDPGESFEDGARREAREESGIEVRLTALAGVYHSPPANAVTAVYRAAALDPDAAVATDHESSEHAWVARSADRRLARPHGVPVDGERRRGLGGRPHRRAVGGRPLRLRYTRSDPTALRRPMPDSPVTRGRHRRRRPDRLLAPLPDRRRADCFGPDTPVRLQLLELDGRAPRPRGRAHGARRLRLPAARGGRLHLRHR